jgi:redox-sensitive bicupin YhaK (pirin superfamily)
METIVESPIRPIALIADSHKAEPAPGLIVDRPLPGPEVDYVSPFLMIDHFGPTIVPAGSSGGLMPHPHRGFETVTLLLEGAMEHQDSAGNHGVLRPGDVQWMTAASGIVHAEYHEREFAKKGGTLQGIQLWVNLPARYKMDPPGYQDLTASRIPRVEVAAGFARVVAGEYSGVRGPARTHTPMTVLHFELSAGGSARIPLPADWNALVYSIRGAASIGDVPLRDRQMAVFADQAGEIAVDAQSECEVLLLAGARIDEPVASWGPFVMNTPQEIMQARKDYASGRMGVLAAR